jgi:hypothetical protein
MTEQDYCISYFSDSAFPTILFLAWLGISGTTEIIDYKNRQHIIDKLIERKKNERL